MCWENEAVVWSSANRRSSNYKSLTNNLTKMRLTFDVWRYVQLFIVGVIAYPCRNPDAVLAISVSKRGPRALSRMMIVYPFPFKALQLLAIWIHSSRFFTKPSWRHGVWPTSRCLSSSIPHPCWRDWRYATTIGSQMCPACTSLSTPRGRTVHPHARLPHPSGSRHHLLQDRTGGGPIESPCGFSDTCTLGRVPAGQSGCCARAGSWGTTATTTQPGDTQGLRDRLGSVFYLLPALHPAVSGPSHWSPLLPAATRSHACFQRGHSDAHNKQRSQSIRLRHSL